MPKRTAIHSILIIGLAVLNGCSKSFPLEQNCEKRVSSSLSKLPIKLDQVHTRLLFDFSGAKSAKAMAVLKDGYADSGPPNIQTCVGDCGKHAINPASKTPIVSPDGKEILVDGPSGPTKKVISQACALESEGVWLKSVSFRPYNPADAENSTMAE